MYLVQSVERAAQVNGNGLATVFQDRRHTWAQFHERVRQLAGGLVARGLNPGDRVAMLSPNSDCYVEYYYGVPWAGGIIVPLNSRWSLAELEYAIEDAGVSALFVDNQYLDKVLQLKDRISCLRHVIVISAEETQNDLLHYETIIRDADPIEPVYRAPEDIYGILYTGGTTGSPKGVMLSTQGLWANVMFMIREYDYRQNEKVIHVAPMFHIAAGASVLAMTGAACTHVIIPAFEPKEVLRVIEQEKIKNIPLIPTMIKMLIDEPAFHKTDLSSLRRIMYGAAPITDQLITQLQEHLPDVEFAQIFGQTEMSPVVSTLRPECHDSSHPLYNKRKSVGQAVYGTNIKIINSSGETLPTGETGEVTVRGPGNMLGYWNKPEQTAETMVDGWIRMGDAGYLDEDGYLYIVDRMKDMIITGGENVYSIEVENALVKHDAVNSCAVIGIPDEKWGERIHAIVVLNTGESVSIEALREHCLTLIADYKCPRSMDVVDKLPLSAANKVLKTELRKPYWQDNA